jgi:elongation factor G
MNIVHAGVECRSKRLEEARLKKIDTPKIRNLVLLGHQDTGKTSFLEAVLFETKQVNRLAAVADGNSNLDFIPEEIERKITMKAKLSHADWSDHRVTFVDTPGYDDFVAERLGPIAAVDSALVFVKADSGVEAGTERLWRALDSVSKPRLVIISKMDKEHANHEACVESLQNLSSNIVPLYLPIGQGETFRGVVDVVDQKAWLFDGGETDVPADMQAAVTAAREAMVNAAAETSDDLVEKYLETGELSEADFHRGLRKGILGGTIYPAIVVAALDSRGVAKALDAIIEYAPSPMDAPPVQGHKPRSSEPMSRPADDSTPTALAFGSVSESNVGDYTYVRVFSGSLKPGLDLVNASTGDGERVGPLFYLNGKNREELDSLVAGEIGAAVKLKHTHVGNTLTASDNPIVVHTLPLPAPLTFVAIRAKDKGDEDKLSGGLQRLHEEDPGFRVEVVSELHQTLLKTQGDTHQNVVIGKLKRKFGVEVETESPRTAYRETIKGKSDERYRHKKQSGGRGQFGEVHMVLEPRERGAEFEFVNAVVGGVIPGKFIPAVEKGVREAMEQGVMAGCAVVDVRVTLDDGKHHPVDSSEAAFKMAASHAFKNAFPKANPVLLEPVYRVEIRVPEEYRGDVMGDMSSRRGRIQGMEATNGRQVVRAEAPLAELYDYASALRSLSHGRGIHTREFSHYEEVPHEVSAAIIAQYKARVEAQT